MTIFGVQLPPLWQMFLLFFGGFICGFFACTLLAANDRVREEDDAPL